ncbi:MAG: hypothetical protein HW383_240, partial [Candidatus Magasanikbacteria bacterium]|nr:hypothetical protein [Candidatus Magasanikbacteria bacterium]
MRQDNNQTTIQIQEPPIKEQELPEAEIREVKRRRPDLWWNGAL